MEIQLSAEEAVQASSSIIDDKDFQLANVEIADVSGVTEHESCSRLFTEMVLAMDAYHKRVQSDAEYITEIAWGLQSVDGDISDYLHSVGTCLGRV